MAIDADLNSGLIDEDTAKRRQELQREAGFTVPWTEPVSSLKDAIAGILITIINLVGGILLFSIREGMGAMEALDKFGKLTIGAGLVSQILPFNIHSLSIIVTRSDDGLSFGNPWGRVNWLTQVYLAGCRGLGLYRCHTWFSHHTLCSCRNHPRDGRLPAIRK